MLLKKGVYPYEYMDEWEEFTETSLPEEFYSNLNIKIQQMQITYKQKEIVEISK